MVVGIVGDYCVWNVVVVQFLCCQEGVLVVWLGFVDLDMDWNIVIMCYIDWCCCCVLIDSGQLVCVVVSEYVDRFVCFFGLCDCCDQFYVVYVDCYVNGDVFVVDIVGEFIGGGDLLFWSNLDKCFLG